MELKITNGEGAEFYIKLINIVDEDKFKENNINTQLMLSFFRGIINELKNQNLLSETGEDLWKEIYGKKEN